MDPSVLSSVQQTMAAVPAVPVPSVPSTVPSVPPVEEASISVPHSVSSLEDVVVSEPAASQSLAVAQSCSSQKNLSTAGVPSGAYSVPLSSADQPVDHPLEPPVLAWSPHSPHLASAKPVQSGGERVPVSASTALLRDSSSSVSRASSTSASVSTTAGRHARARQPCPFEQCQFFTEPWSHHLIQYHLPCFAVPQSACFEVRCQFCAAMTFVSTSAWTSSFSTERVGRLFSESAWHLFLAHGCSVRSDCFPYRA